jgi:hypothetical protein
MPWTIPDKGEGASNLQSILFQEYLDALVAGINGVDCVLAGCAVTAQGTPDMTVAVSKGAVLTNGVLKPVTAGNVTVTTANGSNPRLDLIVVDSTGAKQIRTGTAAASPKPPARSANDVVLAVVYVAANDTAINSNEITDLRLVRTQGPIVIYKTTAAETTDTTASAIHALNKSGSGVTIPNGLFLAGRTLRVRLGGNMLLNSGTPTVTIAITYGGTTMLSDVSAAAVASANRHAWWLDFDLVAQANNDQSLNGLAQIVDVTIAPTNPGTGIGDMFGVNTAAQETQTAYSGSAAVDSDAGDRVLAVTVTFSVSNVANQLVVETATVELL